MLWERRQLGVCVGRAAPLQLPDQGRLGAALGTAGRCAAACTPRTRASSTPSRVLLTPRCGLSVRTATTMRFAERADGGGPTARVATVVATAAAVAAALSAARRRRESGFAGLARDVGPECNGRCARMRTEWHRAAPERLLPGRARPGGHPRPRRCRLQRWWSVSATVIAVT